MKAANETGLVKACLQYLAARGAYAFRVNSGAMTGEYKGKRRFLRFTSAKGCSDILGVYRGRFIAVEAKIPGNKPTPDQRDFLDQVAKKGGLALVIRDVADLAAAIEKEIG